VQGDPLDGADPSGTCGGLAGFICTVWQAATTPGALDQALQAVSPTYAMFGQNAISLCLEGDIAIPVGGEGSFCVVESRLTQIGSTESVGGGFGMGGRLGIGMDVTSAPRISDLEGWSMYGAAGFGVGGDVSVGLAPLLCDSQSEAPVFSGGFGVHGVQVGYIMGDEYMWAQTSFSWGS